MMMEKPKKDPTPQKNDSGMWSAERVHKFRVTYDQAIKDGLHPKSIHETIEFDGNTYVMGYAHYLLEYLETCVFWPPQSRLY